MTMIGFMDRAEQWVRDLSSEKGTNELIRSWTRSPAGDSILCMFDGNVSERREAASRLLKHALFDPTMLALQSVTVKEVKALEMWGCLRDGGEDRWLSVRAEDIGRRRLFLRHFDQARVAPSRSPVAPSALTAQGNVHTGDLCAQCSAVVAAGGDDFERLLASERY
jgi:hypothetical protein